MQNQDEKLFRWILGAGLACLFLAFPEILIAKLLTKNNPEAYDSYVLSMIFTTMFIYATISIIKLVKYQKYVKEYKRSRVEDAKKELTTEFKQVVLNDSLPISKDSFKCQAKIDNEGKIVCKIKVDLDYEMKLENFEEFLEHFHFTED